MFFPGGVKLYYDCLIWWYSSRWSICFWSDWSNVKSSPWILMDDACPVVRTSNCSLGMGITFHETEGVTLLLWTYCGFKFHDLLALCLVCLLSEAVILTIGLEWMVDDIFPSKYEQYEHFKKEINVNEDERLTERVILLCLILLSILWQLITQLSSYVWFFNRFLNRTRICLTLFFVEVDVWIKQ